MWYRELSSIQFQRYKYFPTMVHLHMWYAWAPNSHIAGEQACLFISKHSVMPRGQWYVVYIVWLVCSFNIIAVSLLTMFCTVCRRALGEVVNMIPGADCVLESCGEFLLWYLTVLAMVSASIPATVEELSLNGD